MNARFCAIRIRDAFVVHLRGNQRVAQLPKPELHECCENVRVVYRFQSVISSVYPQPELRDRIVVARYAENAFSASPPKR